MIKKRFLVALLMFITGNALATTQALLRIGTDPYFAPFEYKLPNGKFAGFDIDLGYALCQKMNRQCEFVDVNFDNMIQQLRTRKIDAIISSLSITERRKKVISFSDPLFNVPSRLIARKNSGLLPTVESLKGKSVGVQSGTTQETYAIARWQSQGVRIEPRATQDLIYQDLKLGRLDAALQDEFQAKFGFLTKQDEFKIPADNRFDFAGPRLIDLKLLGVGTAVGLRQSDNQLRQDFNLALKKIKEDGTFRKLEIKYFGEKVFD